MKGRVDKSMWIVTLIPEDLTNIEPTHPLILFSIWCITLLKINTVTILQTEVSQQTNRPTVDFLTPDVVTPQTPDSSYEQQIK